MEELKIYLLDNFHGKLDLADINKILAKTATCFAG